MQLPSKVEVLKLSVASFYVIFLTLLEMPQLPSRFEVLEFSVASPIEVWKLPVATCYVILL